MAAITPEGRAELVALFLTMFGEAPTTLQLARMVTAREQGASLLQIATAAAAELEVDFALVASMDATQFANYLANTLLASDIAASEREWAIDWVITNVQSNKSKLQVIIEAVQGLNATTSPLYASSQAQLDATVAAALNIIDNPVVPGQQLTLTTGADALTSNNAVDTFIATEATLSSADLLNGGAGIDTLRYASSGNAAVNEAGFETSNIEIAQVTADAVGGTLFDTTGMTGLTTLRNSNSSEDVTLVGMSSLVGVELVAVGSAGALANDPTPDTTLVFNAATVAGTADALSLTLNGNLNVDGSGIGDLTAQGIETFNITTTGSASSINTIVSGSVGTINVSGDQNLTIASNLVSAETINASALTGNLSVVADSGAIDVTVTGGSGNDRADFSNGWDLNDSFAGGAGTDTLGLTYTVATGIIAGNSGVASAVEILDVTTAAAANGTIDMDNFGGVTKVILNGGVNNGFTATIADAVTGLEVEMDVDAAASGTLTVNLKTDGSADVETITLDNIGAGDTITALNVVHAETLNISADDDTADGTGTLTITALSAGDATVLNLSGDSDITITNMVDPATAILKTIDASKVTGNVTISGTNTVSTGATITLGSGNDTLNVATSSGADTITLGAGADTVAYNAVVQSDSDMDTITDFVSGTDKLSFSLGNPLLNFRGNQVSFGLAQGALTGGGAPAAGLDAVYQVDDQILWIDSDDNGTLDNNDFRIKLTGVAALVAADLGLTATGNTITVSANAATVNTTTNTNADKVSTNYADTIKATIAQVAAATSLDGALGTDTLELTDAGAIAAIPATVQNVEVLKLATVGSTANVLAGFAATTDFTSVTGSSNGDTITSTANLVAGGTISLGDGVDVITALAANLAGTTIDLGAGNDSLTSTVGAAITSTLVGGDGTDLLSLATADDISGASVSGFEDLTIATGGTVTMTAAQWDALNNGTVTAAGAEVINISDAGTAAAVVAVETYVAAAGGLTLNVGSLVANHVLTGAGGADKYNITANAAGTSWTAADTFAGAGGTDTFTVTVAGDAAVTPAGIVNVENFVATGTATTATTGLAVTFGAGNTLLSSVDISGMTNGATIDMGALATATQTINAKNGAADVIDSSTVAAGVTTTVSLDHGDAFDNNAATGTSDTVVKIYARDNGTSVVTINTAVDFDATDLTLSVYKADGTQVTIAAIAGALSAGTVVAQVSGTTTYVVDVNADGLYGNGDVTINIVGQDLTAGDGLLNGSITF